MIAIVVMIDWISSRQLKINGPLAEKSDLQKGRFFYVHNNQSDFCVASIATAIYLKNGRSLRFSNQRCVISHTMSMEIVVIG